MSLPPTSWRQIKGNETPRPRTNMDRALEGKILCNTMQDLTGVDDLAAQIADALCHLMHTCRLLVDEEGDKIDFEDALATARINFDAEVEEDPDY